jgi:hypothetical protein
VKRIIAAGFAGALIFAGAASAATPTQRIAALEKQVKTLKATVAKQQKAIKLADDRAVAGIAASFCLLAVTTDALQSTWTTLDQAIGSSVFGPQQTIGDGGFCSALQIPRQGIRTPPTTAAFSALVALTQSRTTALRLW